MTLRTGLALAFVALALGGCLRVLTPEEQARQIQFGQALQGAGAALRSPSVGPSACVLTSETPGGTTKVCNYNCGGDIQAVNVGTADLCPR